MGLYPPGFLARKKEGDKTKNIVLQVNGAAALYRAPDIAADISPDGTAALCNAPDNAADGPAELCNAPNNAADGMAVLCNAPDNALDGAREAALSNALYNASNGATALCNALDGTTDGAAISCRALRKYFRRCSCVISCSR